MVLNALEYMKVVDIQFILFLPQFLQEQIIIIILMKVVIIRN